MIDLFRLDGKTAVVTGGGGFLGRELVKSLAECGATVFVADIDEDKGRSVSEELKQKNLDARHVRLDITDEESISHCLREVIEKTGRLDVWVNNAYPRSSDWNSSLEEIPFASWRDNVDRHLNGYFLCCQKAAKIMREKRSGSIINIASIYGMVGPDFSIYEGTSMTMPAAYSAIKGGIINLTRYLASYYGPNGVRFNSISPGGILDKQPKIFVDAYSLKTPLRRMGNPRDVAGAVIYLASDASAYVTGHNLVVDGGWTIV